MSKHTCSDCLYFFDDICIDKDWDDKACDSFCERDDELWKEPN